MNIIKPSVELITPLGYDIDSIKKHIELCGKVCYKSEDNITQSSYAAFYDKIKSNQHLSVLEHGTVYLRITHDEDDKSDISKPLIEKILTEDPHTIVNTGINMDGNDSGISLYITTNMRVLEENNLYDKALKYITEPTQCHDKRYTLKFILPISISREFIRHRHFSFSEMSTRYCNFSKNKFDNQITFIQPEWFKSDCAGSYLSKLEILSKTPIDGYGNGEELFLEYLINCERNYMKLINIGLKAQDARELLPLNTKTELIMTGFEKDWKHFFKLRCDKKAHPMAQILANKAKDILDIQPL